MSDLTVHQPTYSCYSLSVTLDAAMVAVGLPQTVIATHTQDGVFYDYAALCKGRVVSDVLWWARFVLPTWAVLVFTPWLAARSEAQPVRVERGYAYIR